MSFGLLLYETVALIFFIWISAAVIGLLVFHTYLALFNLTTYETIKERRARTDPSARKFNLQQQQGDDAGIGFLGNVMIFHCAELKPHWIYSPKSFQSNLRHRNEPISTQL